MDAIVRVGVRTGQAKGWQPLLRMVPDFEIGGREKGRNLAVRAGFGRLDDWTIGRERPRRSVAREHSQNSGKLRSFRVGAPQSLKTQPLRKYCQHFICMHTYATLCFARAFLGKLLAPGRPRGLVFEGLFSSSRSSSQSFDAWKFFDRFEGKAMTT